MSDLIRREDAIEAIEDITWYHQNSNREMVSGANDAEHQGWYKSQDIYAALESLPSADAVQGEWIPFDRTYGRSIWVCSACDNGTYVPCDASTQKPIYDYCPNCGARMRGEEE